MEWIFLTVGILALLVLVAVLIAVKTRKAKRELDYRIFFIVGIVFVGVGSAMISTTGIASSWMLVLGLAYMAIGIANRGKWKEPQPISDKTRRWVMAIVSGTIVLVVITMLLVLLTV